MAGFLLFVLLPAYSQNRLVSFEKELQVLETYKNTLGVSSIEYADQLANMAIVFRDTTFHDYYNQLSKIIVADHWTVRDHFGIDSEVYRAILVYLSHAYTLGRLFKSVDLDYKPLVRQLILSLEDKINDVEYNKHEFYSLISNIYEADKDYKNVIKWRKRSIEKIGKTNSIDEYLYGVVAAEMPASFEEEALKAQAVVARTYTIYKIENNIGKHDDADICDDYTCCQAWISKDDRIEKWKNERHK